MNRPSLLSWAARSLGEWLIWLLLGTYVLAAFLPAGGRWVGELGFGELRLLGESSRITLSMALLALMLFGAGLGIPLSQLRQLVRAPAILLVGLLANLVVPLLYILVVSLVLRTWPGPDTLQQAVLGLALIAAMPVAASSSVWSQHGNGNLALSLGLILGSTLLSPLTTPVVLRFVGSLTTGNHTDDLEALSGAGMSIFLTAFVLLPSLLGIGVRWLLVALALPLGMCVLAFAAGGAIAALLRAEQGQRTALMFGLGLNSNGTGLVLASVALAHLPGVALPVILSTLVQHLVAAVVNFLNRR